MKDAKKPERGGEAGAVGDLGHGQFLSKGAIA